MIGVAGGGGSAMEGTIGTAGVAGVSVWSGGVIEFEQTVVTGDLSSEFASEGGLLLSSNLTSVINSWNEWLCADGFMSGDSELSTGDDSVDMVNEVLLAALTAVVGVLEPGSEKLEWVESGVQSETVIESEAESLIGMETVEGADARVVSETVSETVTLELVIEMETSVISLESGRTIVVITSDVRGTSLSGALVSAPSSVVEQRVRGTVTSLGDISLGDILSLALLLTTPWPSVVKWYVSRVRDVSMGAILSSSVSVRFSLTVNTPPSSVVGK